MNNNERRNRKIREEEDILKSGIFEKSWLNSSRDPSIWK